MAPSISLPSGGLALSDFPTDLSKRKNGLKQAIEIVSIEGESFENIVSSLRDGVEATVSLGKKPVILLDKKAIAIKTTYQSQSLMFKQSKDSKGLELIAALTLKDALARVKLARSRDIVDMNDPGILALQATLAQVQEQKDANQAIVVNSSRLPSSMNGRSALSSLKNHRQGMFGGNNTSRSNPGSPAIGDTTPRSVKRDSRSLKDEAVKRSFIHLLAVRAVSEKYMASVLHASKDDLAPLLNKYGKPITEPITDGSKYNLSDRGYKELDPWAFPYRDESDRNGVIERAISAFDRLRISVTDPLWQKLLKKEERGKGKILSKLSNLQHGPVERVKTPKIQLDPSAEGNPSSQSTERGKHLAPSHTTTGTKSQDSLKKTTSSASSSSISSTNSTQASDMARAQKSSDLKKKESPKKMDPKKSIAKKPASKPVPVTGKVKSAEFIEDSDEEIASDEIATQSSQPSKKRKAEDDLSPAGKKVDVKKTIVKPAPKPMVEKIVSKTKPNSPSSTKPIKKPEPASAKTSQDTAMRKTASQPTHPSSTKKKIPESQRPIAMARSVSAKKGTSPVKPSPLGSSPPTNASDLEQEKDTKANSSKSASSSSSGSPLINQRRERLQQEAKRIAIPSPSNNSDRNLKRRVNDLENGNHLHGGFSTRETSSSSSEKAVRRQRLSESSPSSESDQRSNASSNTSPSVVLSPKDLEYARSFKSQWQKYAAGLRDLSALSDPPPEKVEQLQRLYAKLVAHKAEICSWDKKESA